MTDACRRYWRSYRGCRCYDERTGQLKPAVARALGTSPDGLCGCPAAVFVGRRRAKLLARQFPASPVATRRRPWAALGGLLRSLWRRVGLGGAAWLRGMP